MQMTADEVNLEALKVNNSHFHLAMSEVVSTVDQEEVKTCQDFGQKRLSSVI